MKYSIVISLLLFHGAHILANEHNSSLPSRDPVVVIPLLQAFTSLKTYQDVLNILGKPDLDIGSASPDGVFFLIDGSRIRATTLTHVNPTFSKTEINNITLSPPRSMETAIHETTLFEAKKSAEQGAATNP